MKILDLTQTIDPSRIDPESSDELIYMEEAPRLLEVDYVVIDFARANEAAIRSLENVFPRKILYLNADATQKQTLTYGFDLMPYAEDVYGAMTKYLFWDSVAEI